MTKHGIEPLPSGHEIMEHVVKSVIGEGGFGIVYLAEHPKLRIRAAVKEFAPFKLAYRDETGALVPLEGKEGLYQQILDRFDTTAAQLCALDHPNIVKVFNQRSDNNTSYVLMEFVTGQTFGDWVHGRIDELDYGQLKAVLLPLLDAIEYLHNRHLMHRDIAPDNILMRQDGVPILIDFGTLKQHVLGEETNLDGADDNDPSAVVAKKFFSPPEQFSAYRKSELGSTADIYSLGATIYDVLAGRAEDQTRYLVPATDRASSVVAPGGRPMPPLREVTRVPLPESFCQAVDTALSLSPRDRPPNIAAFRAMLFQDETAPGPVPPANPQPAPVQQPQAAVQTNVHTQPQTTATDGGIPWGRLAGLGTVGALAVGAGIFVVVQAGDTNGDTSSPNPPPDPAIVEPAEFNLALARSVSGLTATGVVPPALRTALENVFGADSIGPDLEVADDLSVPDGLDLSGLAQVVQDWTSFALTAGPDGARLQGEPADAQSYFDALETAGDLVDLDLSFLTRSLPREDVIALLDFHDPCGTIIPLNLSSQLTPNDQLSLFGHVASVQDGIDLRRELVLLLPGALDGDALVPTSQAMCDVARQFRDLVGDSPEQVGALRVTMNGIPAELGEPVSHTDAPQFAVARDALPATGFLWSGLVMRGPDGQLLMLPLSQPSGDVEDLGVLSRSAGAPEYIALTRPAEDTPNLDLAFSPELALTFDPTDTYAMLLGLVLDREISGLPSLGATTAPDASDYLTELQNAVARSGATILSHFQQPIAIE